MKRLLVLLSISLGLALLVAQREGAGAQTSGLTIFGLTSTNSLISFNTSTPGTIISTVAITGLSPDETILGVDFRPRDKQLYAVSSASRLYTINTATGAATVVGTTAFTPAVVGAGVGVDFNPVPDRLRVTTDTDQNLRLNPATGAVAATDAALTFATGDVNAAADPNMAGAAYTNSFDFATSTTLYGIDSTLNILVRQGSIGGAPDSPNNGKLTTVGALGVDTTDQVGFDIAAPNDVAFASLTVTGATSSSLYSINLNNGAATLVGAIGGGAVIRDIAIPVIFIPSAQQAGFAVVNAASFTGDVIAPESIVSIFGNFQTTNNQSASASTTPLPTMLAGVKVTVNGTDASLFFAGPTQINALVPAGTPDGQATFSITDTTGVQRAGTVSIARTGPGLLTVNTAGTGTASGLFTTDGVQYLPLINTDGSERALDPGTAAQPNFLILFGTGLRNAPADNPADGNGVAEAVTVTIQGVPAPVVFAAKHGDLAGLDQINVKIPAELAGIGKALVRVVVNGQPSNVVTVTLGGTAPAVVANNIAIGQTIGGALAATDQVTRDEAGRTYFFDAYQFSTSALTGLAIDVRSSVFDPAVILYKRGANNTLTPVGTDDDLGALGDGDFVNKNALLLTAVAESGDYILFVTSSTKNENGVGGYTVRLSGNAVQSAAYGANINGSFAAGDVQTAAGDFIDAYYFTGVAGDRVQLTMSSTAFDPLLILNGNNGDITAFDDNSGGGTTAQVIGVLPDTGIYVVVATPFAPNVGGDYNLTINRVTSAAAAAKTIIRPDGSPARLALKRISPEALEDTRFEKFTTRRVITQ
jgi:uncharacterized protein (TIGR03437 family)